MKVLLWISYGCKDIYALDDPDNLLALKEELIEVSNQNFLQDYLKEELTINMGITKIVNLINSVSDDVDSFETLEIIEVR